MHRVYNYGSVLQAWATQSVLENAGHEVLLIDYITPQRTKKSIFFGKSGEWRSWGAKEYVYHFFMIFSIILKEMTFGRFIHNMLNLSKKYITVDDLERDIPSADLYITGSDQVWNSDYNEGVDRGYYLDFLPENAKRVAFVSSFGQTDIPITEAEEVKKYLNRYQAVSVREKSAIKMIEGLGIDKVEWLIDPTLQISKEKWVELASRRLIKEKYVILMLLYNEDNHATEFARKIANEKGLQLVKISWEMKKPALIDKLMTHRSPEDFLSLFYYSDFIVTNSFHGTAFSINFEKDFVVVPRKEYNSRIESLLSLVNLEDRLVSDEVNLMNILNKKIDYHYVRKVLKQERKKAAEFIENSIR